MTVTDVDVAVVGGGPAGCSAGVFTARYGFETVIFDRGRSSLRRCAHLENYPGFPAGIDVDTFYELLHDHAARAGCELLPALVEAVEPENGEFVLETQDDRRVVAKRVVAATRYGGEYLSSLDDAMFEDDENERFDRSYATENGRTPMDGLYVASPSAQSDRQAIIAAGRGARVAHALIADARRERGYPDSLAEQYDWLRREGELTGEWRERERWREWFDERAPDDWSGERRAARREAAIDRRLAEFLPAAERERRAADGHDRLLDHIDDERILARAREIERESSGVET